MATDCPTPFLNEADFVTPGGGFAEGRVCQAYFNLTCCVPCPMTDWAYPDTFNTLGLAAEWVSVVSMICSVFLLLSWLVLPVEKTHRHYLSISLTIAVVLMNLGFVIPLAGQPTECYDDITPNGMNSSSVCAASGSILILGGWAGILWVFLRSLSLHLQICWQLVVGRNFMWLAHVAGWGIPIIGIILALTLSGVSFRFGSTCHINHKNSLADLWIPLLVFAGFTIVIQFATFGYCIKVYLASLADNSASTEGSNMPSYTNSIRTMTPRQAYRRVRRVIQLQWRGIAIALIIVADVILFSVVFVFQDNTLETVKHDPDKATEWVTCLVLNGGDKNKCLNQASSLVVNMATVGAVLLLLSMNGIWLIILLGRWSMVTGWMELVTKTPARSKREFVSVDARLDDLKKDPLSPMSPSAASRARSPPPSGLAYYNMYSGATTSPDATSPGGGGHNHTGSFASANGRRTPDYFGQTARYHTPARSFSSPRPPQQGSGSWDARETYARPGTSNMEYEDMNPLGMNRI
ncbi:Frizzled/smoothened-like sans CRD protein B [Pleurostoma richardsiae]|uniref:Frizzled/smoothened-like sans CRD protein B n=1 Tax=Pleurostoma richardsiae TaxID=41990 RepID=A0AA38VDF8_9PEZI|nr:Frizzled/smoothened-like sans CRD protein B [Pleurostoma richardsiae]